MPKIQFDGKSVCILPRICFMSTIINTLQIVAIVTGWKNVLLASTEERAKEALLRFNFI